MKASQSARGCAGSVRSEAISQRSGRAGSRSQTLSQTDNSTRASQKRASLTKPTAQVSTQNPWGTPEAPIGDFTLAFLETFPLPVQSSVYQDPNEQLDPFVPVFENVVTNLDKLSQLSLVADKLDTMTSTNSVLPPDTLIRATQNCKHIQEIFEAWTPEQLSFAETYIAELQDSPRATLPFKAQKQLYDARTALDLLTLYLKRSEDSNLSLQLSEMISSLTTLQTNLEEIIHNTAP